MIMQQGTHHFNTQRRRALFYGPTQELIEVFNLSSVNRRCWARRWRCIFSQFSEHQIDSSRCLAPRCRVSHPDKSNEPVDTVILCMIDEARALAITEVDRPWLIVAEQNESSVPHGNVVERQLKSGAAPINFIDKL